MQQNDKQKNQQRPVNQLLQIKYKENKTKKCTFDRPIQTIKKLPTNSQTETMEHGFKCTYLYTSNGHKKKTR